MNARLCKVLCSCKDVFLTIGRGLNLASITNSTPLQLPVDMSVTWNKKMRKTAGYCISGQERGTGKRYARIELSVKVCDSPGTCYSFQNAMNINKNKSMFRICYIHARNPVFSCDNRSVARYVSS